MTENEFRALCQEKGYAEVKVKDFEPHLYDPAHTHERSIIGLVVSGEMTLEWENGASTYGVGDICEFEAERCTPKKQARTGQPLSWVSNNDAFPASQNPKRTGWSAVRVGDRRRVCVTR
jgi:hypothetical protein